MHKNYCNYPNDPCDCGYYNKQKWHSSWCDYPKEPCSCNKDKSQYDIDNRKEE